MWPFSWFMKEDPTAVRPKPRGKTSWWPLIAFVIVLAFAGKGCQENKAPDPCPPGACKPVPHSTISPEDVERLP